MVDTARDRNDPDAEWPRI